MIKDVEPLLKECEETLKDLLSMGKTEAACYVQGFINSINKLPEAERPNGTCKTCKHYIPYKEQFSYRNRGDGYCKSTITTSEGNAYINCHDEWYCANYEKEGGTK